MLSKKSLVISLSLLTLITTQADAGSKQYYKYYLKVRSANILWGIVGDHTYVCIKKKKKRHHKKDKTIRNYGCHAADGGIYRDAAT